MNAKKKDLLAVLSLLQEMQDQGKLSLEEVAGAKVPANLQSLLEGSSSQENPEAAPEIDLEEFQESVTDEELLAKAYPHASIDRIAIERQFQASHYVMRKFLLSDPATQEEQENREKSAFEDDDEAQKHTSDHSFREFVCPICLKLIQKCVTTMCGHSYCEACLEDYLLFKPVGDRIYPSNCVL